MDEQTLQIRFPEIDWRTPLTVWFGKKAQHACRYCIVQHQLNPNDLYLFAYSYQDWQRHIFAVHGLGRKAA